MSVFDFFRQRRPEVRYEVTIEGVGCSEPWWIRHTGPAASVEQAVTRALRDTDLGGDDFDIKVRVIRD